jgi:hypothetical protein
MTIDWAPQQHNPEFVAPTTRAARRSDGRIVLLTGRIQASETLRLAAELDGPNLFALAERNRTRCNTGFERSDGDYYVLRVNDSESKGTLSGLGGGAVGERWDQRSPKVLKHYHDALAHSYVGGTPGLLETTGAMQLSAWADGRVLREIPIHDAEGSLAQNYQFFAGSTLFWAADTMRINKQKVYTESDGTKDFISFGSDPSKGAADLGTDGKDFVWVEGSDRVSGDGPFPKVLAATSPFTSAPAKLQRRVLRADLTGYPFGTKPFVVGCGYAARSTTMMRDGGLVGGTLVIRLTDGFAWHLPDQDDAWGWRTPLALTCTELVALVWERPPSAERGHFNIARVRLDSLGAPNAP